MADGFISNDFEKDLRERLEKLHRLEELRVEWREKDEAAMEVWRRLKEAEAELKGCPTCGAKQ